MTDNLQFDWQQVFELTKRMMPDFRAFCASVDLLGVEEGIARDPEEAKQRLNDLQQGFGEALIFFPGGEDYRVCFVGDSLFVVKELTPPENDG